MRGVAEPVNPEAVPIAGFTVGAKAEAAGAQKRRNSRLGRTGFDGQVDIEKFVRERETISRVGNSELSVTTINRVTGKFRAVAKIFAIRSTISTFAIGPAEPRNAHAV